MDASSKGEGSERGFGSGALSGFEQRGNTEIRAERPRLYHVRVMLPSRGSRKTLSLPCDYWTAGYSEEGHMFYNFGQEGVSYKMENGYPEIYRSTDEESGKLAPAQAMSLYIRGNSGGRSSRTSAISSSILHFRSSRRQSKFGRRRIPTNSLSDFPRQLRRNRPSSAKIMNDVNTLMDEDDVENYIGSRASGCLRQIYGKAEKA